MPVANTQVTRIHTKLLKNAIRFLNCVVEDM